MNQDECWADIRRKIEHLEKQMEILAGRLRMLQFIVIGGMVLDLVVKSSKAAAFFR